MADARFTATLLDGHKGAAVEVPFDPAERWGREAERLQAGRRGHRVTGTINGVGFNSAIVSRSRKFFVLIVDAVRERAKLDVGDSVRIVLRPAAATQMIKPAVALARVRKICLSLDGVEEKISHGAPTWRIRAGVFAMFADNHHGDGRIAVWCAAPAGVQNDLVAAEPQHFFVPPYVGVNGWLGMRVDTGLAPGALAALVEQAHATIAAKRTRKRQPAGVEPV